MEFSLTEDQREFRDEFRTWLEANVPDWWEERDRTLPDDEDERLELQQEWYQRLYDDNWVAPRWPEEFGGMDLGPIEMLVYQRELDRIDAPPILNESWLNWVGPAIIEKGSEWQEERFLPPMLEAEELWCLGYSEPDHGSDIAGLETQAERDGDEFVINGQKIWTSQAHFADYCALMARTDFSGTKHEGITSIIVDLDQEGVTIEPIRQISDSYGFNQVFYDDARAPVEHVIGEVGKGWEVIRAISSYEQSWSYAFEAERRFNEILQYCQNTKRNGTPLAEIPRIRRKLAQFDTRIQAAIVTRYRQISKRIDNPQPGPEGSLDVVKGDELMVDLEAFAVTLTGPRATLWGDGLDGGRHVESWIQSFGTWIGGGTGDIQRNIIGERVLGLPKDDKSQYTHRPGNEPPEDASGA